MAVCAALGAFYFLVAEDGKIRRLVHEAAGDLLHQGTEVLRFSSARRFEVYGWDECFPAIDPWGGYPAMGALVGRSSDTRLDGMRLETEWRSDAFYARRTIRLASPTAVELSFEAENLSGSDMPFLWASHALFPLDRLKSIEYGKGQSVALDVEKGTERKAFVSARNNPLRCDYAAYSLMLETDQPWWGVWMYGGKLGEGEEGSTGCVGLEASSDAAELPDAGVLVSGRPFRGRVGVDVCLA